MWSMIGKRLCWDWRDIESLWQCAIRRISTWQQGKLSFWSIISQDYPPMLRRLCRDSGWYRIEGTDGYKWQIMAQNNKDHSGFCEPLGCVCKHLQPVKLELGARGSVLKEHGESSNVVSLCFFFMALYLLINLYCCCSFAYSCSLTSTYWFNAALQALWGHAATFFHGSAWTIFGCFTRGAHIGVCDALLVLCTWSGPKWRQGEARWSPRKGRFFWKLVLMIFLGSVLNQDESSV